MRRGGWRSVETPNRNGICRPVSRNREQKSSSLVSPFPTLHTPTLPRPPLESTSLFFCSFQTLSDTYHSLRQRISLSQQPKKTLTFLRIASSEQHQNMFISLQLNSNRLLLRHPWINAVVADCRSSDTEFARGALAVALCCMDI
jgi:hypothetical protein